MKTPENNLFLIVMGVTRVRIDEFSQFEPYLRAKIHAIPDEKEDETAVDFQALKRTVVSQFERIVKLSPQLPDDLLDQRGRDLRVRGLPDPGSAWPPGGDTSRARRCRRRSGSPDRPDESHDAGRGSRVATLAK
jgi:hypothetical protein